ncbi:hypothetical protein E3N88_21750 [Mikania micrantha]|uniref:Uncharacterized protein n=1 Tax=Mikania micrantha TaxID=192012 RepID=A0A5N6N9E4_9ASTR|nr:hypothetical protein E3N88_21750 [Mikania micrantha]
MLSTTASMPTFTVVFCTCARLDETMAGGFKLFTERSDDGAAGTPVLDTASGEELMHASSVVERYQKGYLVDFLSVSLHAVSRDPEAFESPCL